MSIVGWLQIGLLCLVVLALIKPLGLFMAKVLSGERTLLSPVLEPVERGFYAASGVDPAKEQGWLGYTLAMIAFSMAGFALLYAILRLQLYLPLNPQGFAGMAPDLAFNTAVSFVTNTNWQSYGGETTMSHFSQMAGLTVQNFLSAATGIAIAMAVTRAFSRSKAQTVGNFWVDVTRATLYVLLPLAIIVALVFVAMGLPQTLDASVTATTVEGAHQTIALGPVASQEAIKQLGTNGGGFFNVNAAHPFENPTALSNYLNIVAMLSVSAALVYAFGQGVGDRRQGWAFLAATGILLIAGVGCIYWAETYGNPILTGLGLDTCTWQHGGQGSSLRPGDDGSLRGGYDGPFRRRRQRDARLVHRTWRPGADVPDPTRRGTAWRRRLGPLRHGGVRDADRFRRRSDGRSYPGTARARRSKAAR